MTTGRLFVAAMTALCSAFFAGAQTTVYADASATGVGDGSSWADAFTSLQPAIDTLEPGDTLMSRGTFFEAVDVRTENIIWLGSEDAVNPTWLRGDRYPDPADWAQTATPGVWRLGGVAALIGTTLEPGSVVYDYKRDDFSGTVTGVNIAARLEVLPTNGAGVYYGHLLPATDLADVSQTPGSWWWDEPNDAVYVSEPSGGAFDPALLGVCYNGINGVLVWKGGLHIKGVNTLCTPGFAQNAGYGIKGYATFTDVLIEDCDIIDSGWHAAGFDIGSASDCTIRNVRAWSGGVDGSNANIPFVFYSALRQVDAGHLGEDLVFHAYPLLGVDGAPIYDLFRPTLGYSHSQGFGTFDLGGVTWRRCWLVDYQQDLIAKHGPVTYWGAGIAANDMPPSPRLVYEDYPVKVEDCVLEGSSAAPRTGLAYDRCVFAPGLSPLDGEFRTRLGTDTYLRSCTIELGLAGTGDASAYFILDAGSSLTLEMCTIHAEQDNPLQNVFRLSARPITARQCVFSVKQPVSMLYVWPGPGWDDMASLHTFEQCYYAGPLVYAEAAWGAPPRDETWWSANIDAAGATGPTGDFIDPAGRDLRPQPGGALYTERSAAAIPGLLGLSDLDGSPYARSYGAWQRPCVADVNRDTFALFSDFAAWIAAFNAGDPAADANGNGTVEPGDLNAWIAAYHVGCG